MPAADRLTCNPPTNSFQLKTKKYYVKSFAPYVPLVYTNDGYNPTSGCSAFIRGEDVSCPFLFIQEAINSLMTL